MLDTLFLQVQFRLVYLLRSIWKRGLWGLFEGSQNQTCRLQRYVISTVCVVLMSHRVSTHRTLWSITKDVEYRFIAKKLSQYQYTVMSLYIKKPIQSSISLYIKHIEKGGKKGERDHVVPCHRRSVSGLHVGCRRKRQKQAPGSHVAPRLAVQPME